MKHFTLCKSRFFSLKFNVSFKSSGIILSPCTECLQEKWWRKIFEKIHTRCTNIYFQLFFLQFCIKICIKAVRHVECGRMEGGDVVRGLTFHHLIECVVCVCACVCSSLCGSVKIVRFNDVFWINDKNIWRQRHLAREYMKINYYIL